MLLTVWCSLYTQTCMHACSSPRQPHPLRRSGERCNSSPLPCWLLRQSDWPRLLKMDLEHLPFIAFPLPLPDVTAEHDFPRNKKKKKKKSSAALSYTQNNRKEKVLLPFLRAASVLFSNAVFFVFFLLFPCFLAFCPRCKMWNDIRNAVVCGQCCNNNVLRNEALPVQLWRPSPL